VPRKSIFGIPDDFFKDHYADLPDNWEALLVELAFLFDSLLKIFCIKGRPKCIRKRAKGTDAEQKEHPYSKAIVKLIGLIVTVIVDSTFLVGRATVAATIGLINTMLVSVWSYLIHIQMCHLL
jgi:hypothetical protein